MMKQNTWQVLVEFRIKYNGNINGSLYLKLIPSSANQWDQISNQQTALGLITKKKLKPTDSE